ncbi:alpha-mannosidase IC [Boeremia exigua]|uniref:alpha-mannosidase IC n=1 Tax=Boeremia exigua TaxID=749465 RepID=UPI001E8CC937|nr:alpha-mannosidase IC [Boeremia exigua]KAH6614160.1 alpha-mannosidase IC [Boeremia exigua]
MLFGKYRWPICLLAGTAFLVTVALLSARSTPYTSSIVRVNSHGQSGPLAGSPTPVQSPHACPTAPPTPALIPNTSGRFDWRTVPKHHPLQEYSQLSQEKPTPRPSVQHTFTPASPEAKNANAARKDAVRQVFKRCWTAYKDRAWTKDELAPISGRARDTFGSWGATLVDSLDTLWIMDMKAEFAEAMDAAVQIDFGPKIDGEINVFETIIRYLGGFLGAYDVSGCHDARLLNKAMEVADLAYAAFDTPNRMPVSRWSPKKAVDGEEQLPAESMLIAEAASASLEFTRLSQLTGDMRYFDAISRVTDVLDKQQGLTKLPGMWPISVNMRKPDLTFDGFFGLGAMADSAYEYLPKMHLLLNGIGPVAVQYQKMYEYAMSTAIAHTLFRPMVHDKADILIASANVNGERDSKGQHLVCFAGGMFALGGRLFDNSTHMDVGRKITDGCAWTYKNAPNGIMPEVFTMPACPSLAACDFTLPPGSSPFSEVNDGRYVLRPEAIESVFVMYRITGEAKYQDIAWEMFQAIDKHTRTEFANAAIGDVMKTPAERYDSMESFWLAETLKYFYLIFSEPDTLSLDDFVLNTEAHPFRIPYH